MVDAVLDVVNLVSQVAVRRFQVGEPLGSGVGDAIAGVELILICFGS